MMIYEFWSRLIGTAMFCGLASCTPIDHVYRPLPLMTQVKAGTDPGCDIPIELARGDYNASANSETTSGQTNVSRTSCYLSTYIVPNADLWENQPGQHTIEEPDRYTLSFVELPDYRPNLRAPEQLEDLLRHLSGDNQDIVMTYVHGWRHDADIGNSNVLRFRTMLGYARSALNARCKEVGQYCKSRLTGVYVGWRGRSFSELTENAAAASGAPGAIPTVWGRKRQSERLAQPAGFNFKFPNDQEILEPIAPIGYVLKSIEAALDLKQGNPRFDKMMVMGHSFGGNMLATYLEPLATSRVGEHVLGDTMDPLIGDLVVLINPAAEARKWTMIQRAMRERAEISDNNYLVSFPNEAPATQVKRIRDWQRMFPTDQRPVYVSITSATNWNPGEFNAQERGRDVDYDKATGILFPASRIVTGVFDRERKTAIGHLIPDYTKHPKYRFGQVAGPPYGVSHEVIVNRGAGLITSYENSGHPAKARCGSHDGWLRQAQTNDYGGFPTTLENWDSGYSNNRGQTPPLLSNMSNNAEIQFRHALYLDITDPARPKGLRSESVAQGRSPFWNVRALDTAVANHSDFVNFATLCGISTLWLDDATR